MLPTLPPSPSAIYTAAPILEKWGDKGMIAALRGILETKTLTAALVRVGGVTFLVHAPVTTLSQLTTIGQEVTLHTYLHLRQDEIALYGFASADDRQLFETLLGVTGVGPRMGLAILSSM